MLAAMDVPSLSPSDEGWESAIHGSSGDLHIELLPYNQVLKISGSGSGNLTVDLGKLPSSIVNIQISSFESVTLTGEHSVTSLALTDVRQVDAGHISIEYLLFAQDVARIKIDVTPDIVWLQAGDGGVASKKTLLEADQFSAGVIFTKGLDSLGIESSGPVNELNVVSASPQQTLMLNFQPDHLNVAGFDAPAQQISVIHGDFTRYFLASPAERSALEQSLLVARQAAATTPIALTSLLNRPAMQAMLGELAETNGNPAKFRTRPVELDLGVVRTSPESLATRTAPSASDSTHANRIDTDFVNPSSSVSETDVSQATASEKLDTAEQIGGGSQFSPSAPQTPPLQATDILALSLALARLGEPLTQTLSDLQGRFVTFGDIVSARVSDQLRTDARPALLADTRLPREQRQEQELVVVNV